MLRNTQYAKRNTHFAIPFIIAVSAIALFIPFLGSVHLFDWDEINFAESAREMIVTGNYSRVQIDFQPFWEKPPLFFWLQTISMHIFGINEFAARLPNAFIGIVTLLTFYFIGKKMFDEKFGFIWAITYMGSFLPNLYFKSGIIDPVYNYFIFLTFYFLIKGINVKDGKQLSLNMIFAGVSLGLATLTKGPVGLLIVILCAGIYWIFNNFRKYITLKGIVIFFITYGIIAFTWFGWEMIKNGTWFISEFFKYQLALFFSPVAGHSEPFYYHFAVVFLGCFPMSILALPVLFKRKTGDYIFLKWMRILFWVVMILFTIVKTKIVHYSSLAYFPLSFLAAFFIYELLNSRMVFKKYVLWIMIFIGTVFSLLLIGLPIIARHNEIIIPYIKDPFAVACLSTSVSWTGYEFLTGLVYLILLITAIVLILKNKILKGFVMMFYSTAICLFIYLITVVPKIEAYSQAPAIDFYKSISGKDVYVNTFHFKSYAQYFYFQKMPAGNLNSSNEEWLMKGNIDKPVYIVVKSTAGKDMESYPQFKLLKQEGGFLFYLRNP